MSGELTHAELKTIHSEISKLIEETSRLNAPSGRPTFDNFWLPMILGASLVCTVAGITAMIVKAHLLHC
ncbi:hypothetical protein [Pseudomonas oryzihabitans]|uniref:Uncharacterized protein n=1 Tax=Pseudomonas oryzihabitans TaxID=47885 RepID=A0ABX3IQN1_9PSED|nr:hypothetical protein [Pseudomonas psychrotolerans]ONN70676.1 hypothetical protein BVL52_20800 [Pseudomonas psychrotolerans]